VFFLLLGMTLPAAHAQEVAALTGVVTDASGGTVSDAKVTLVDSRTGAKFDAKTISDGTYRIPKVSPGPGYTLTITKDGIRECGWGPTPLGVSILLTGSGSPRGSVLAAPQRIPHFLQFFLLRFLHVGEGQI
jgi:hypothetical protein